MNEEIIEKLKKEQEELTSKIDKLDNFIKTDKFKQLDKTQRILLTQQQKILSIYHNILYMRIENLKGVKL